MRWSRSSVRRAYPHRCRPTRRGGSSSWISSAASSLGTVGLWRSDLFALLHHLQELLVLVVLDRVAVIVVGEFSGFHLGDVLLDAAHGDLGQVRVALREF